ncbi:MAG: DUF6261 family protein [Paludibacter sp.]|nr:DUF6261 family protein [Paludibacter sp.]
MEIANLNLHNQRNAGHYQFLTDFNDFVIKYTPQVLGIVDAYAAFLLKYQDEIEAYKAITKSATTDDIVNADHDRDITLRSTSNLAHTAMNHFDANVHNAAKIVNVIIDQYGDLASKPYDEETGEVENMIKDLRTKAGAEIVTVGLVPWINMLETQNITFKTLEATRNSEEANRTELRMKQVRLEIDAAYRKITKRINALIEVNGEAPYAEFVKELNARIGRAQDSIAQSKSRKTTIVVTEAPKA